VAGPLECQIQALVAVKVVNHLLIPCTAQGHL
jgi:hypothetical protein